jgi:Fe2+ or Zn2+ uptake regulation protein
MFEKYIKLLERKSIKTTLQRLEILRYLDNHRTHPTTNQIYSDLKKKNPSLSKTTVYNSLKIFREHSIIQTLTISSSEIRYDFNCSIHRHFLCKKCGKIIDINSSCPYIVKIRKDGYQIDEAHGYFKGICKECLHKEKTKVEQVKYKVYLLKLIQSREKHALDKMLRI